MDARKVGEGLPLFEGGDLIALSQVGSNDRLFLRMIQLPCLNIEGTMQPSVHEVRPCPL
jgi:hypothetical protein